jgi:formylglycine-generating enzyme required for sulfatase activity
MKSKLYFFSGLVLLVFMVCSCKKDSNPVVVQPNYSPSSIKWVTVPGGTFKMGDTSSAAGIDESPIHVVTLDTFQISATEVTFGQFDAFCDSTHRKKPSDYGWGRGDRPVIWITWKDASDYCAWLTKQLGGDTVKLPTEAQWEYAAGDGSQHTIFSGTNDISTISNYAWFDGSSTEPVAGKQPNSLGIYDMSGNAWEWCSDYYGLYSKDTVSNPKGPISGVVRVIRGGSWGFSSAYCRTTGRQYETTTSSEFNLGFRVVRK